jgi:hypothetical protein
MEVKPTINMSLSAPKAQHKSHRERLIAISRENNKIAIKIAQIRLTILSETANLSHLHQYPSCIE